MKLVETKVANDGYTFALVANDTRFGVINGFHDTDMNGEVDVDPEWFWTQEEAKEWMESEFNWWNNT